MHGNTENCMCSFTFRSAEKASLLVILEMMSLVPEIVCLFVETEENVICKSIYLVNQVIMCFSGKEIKKSNSRNRRVTHISYSK